MAHGCPWPSIYRYSSASFGGIYRSLKELWVYFLFLATQFKVSQANARCNQHFKNHLQELRTRLHLHLANFSRLFPSSFNSLAWLIFSATEPFLRSSRIFLSWQHRSGDQSRFSGVSDSVYRLINKLRRVPQSTKFVLRSPSLPYHACSPWKMVFWNRDGKLFHICILY